MSQFRGYCKARSNWQNGCSNSGDQRRLFYSRHGCEQPLFPLLTWDDRIYTRSHNSSCGSQVVLLPTPGRLCLSSGHKPSLPTMSVDQTRSVISQTMISSFEFDFPQNTQPEIMPSPYYPFMSRATEAKKRKKMTPDLSLQNTPRDPH